MSEVLPSSNPDSVNFVGSNTDPVASLVDVVNPICSGATNVCNNNNDNNSTISSVNGLSSSSPPLRDVENNSGTRTKNKKLVNGVDTSGFYLHLKSPPPIDFAALDSLPCVSQSSRDQMLSTRRWLWDTSLYSCILPRRTANGCKQTSLSQDQVDEVVAARGCAEIHRSKVKGWVNMFTVVEWFKKRFRIIRDTLSVNEFYDKSSLIGLKFITKSELCSLVNMGDFFAAFDMTGYYDQFFYSDEVSEYMCFRSGNKYYRTSRLCMGQRQGCDIAQTTTLFLLDFPGRRCKAVHAYIDNVIFVGSYEDVLHDSKIFIERCRAATVTLNEENLMKEGGVESCILKKGEWCGVFLDFENKTCSLSEKTIVKTEISWNNIDNWTYRQFSAHVGLLFWSWGIIDVPVYEFYSLLKFISETSRRLQQDDSMWDSKIAIYPSALPALQRWTRLVLENKPNKVLPPSRNKTWFICTDASKWGWGYRAFNYKTGEIRSFGQSWRASQNGRFSFLSRDQTSHSVYAEPVGIYMSLVHLLSNDPSVKYRVINPKNDENCSENFCQMNLGTDSFSVFDSEWRQAINVATDNSSAKFTFNRGFASRSFIINQAILLLRRSFPKDTFDITFSFVPGKLNPGDKPSRGIADNNNDHANDCDDIRTLTRLADQALHDKILDSTFSG